MLDNISFFHLNGRAMNRLPVETRVQILSMLCEGSSMRSITRITGVSINTVSKLLIDAGLACAAFHDKTVRGVTAKAVQCDEIWSFSYAKQKNVKFAKAAPEAAGDVWTWTAIDADSKLIVSWHVGDRSQHTGIAFMGDLKARLANRVQLTTDGHKAYLKAVAAVDFDADYAVLSKIFATDYAGAGRYSPPKCIGAVKQAILGNPDPELIKKSFAERQNLTMRVSMRRFTRLTNAFSKKLENHCHALALYFVFYNFCRVHKTLGAAPAMAAGLIDRVIKMTDVVELIDAANPGPCKKREAVENSN
ncbi:IS1 family transposase [Bradyrhizobium japonicum]|nr:IS1 family transposase [Bradyrhizobium japonicum]MCP1856016.1 IS1 family transposase [Bradyrhizobium japonicum]MCP1897169.1 IS1 family transposase [Bradyrhizobium japonicum]MCW2330783.1 IS1 family transposase [Bradyrhizobium japonicum]